MSLQNICILICGLALFGTSQLNGQNLVPNPSFEEYDECPELPPGGKIIHAIPWFTPNESYGPGGSSDYFNACSDSNTYGVPQSLWGFQQARTGEAYAGFAPGRPTGEDYREYLEVRLTNPLVSQVNYYCEFYISTAPESYKYGIDKLGMYFSEDSLATPNWSPILLTPQVENNGGVILNDSQWVKISGVFTAAGNEQFLTIGNFHPNSQTTYQQIPSYAGGSPSTYYFIDDVLVIPDSLTSVPNSEISRFTIWPNPSSSIVQMRLSGLTEYVSVHDIQGRLMFSEKPKRFELEFDVSSWSDGMYLIQLIDDSGIPTVERLNVQH